MNETILELEKIKDYYIEKGDWISANQISSAIDVVLDYDCVTNLNQ